MRIAGKGWRNGSTQTGREAIRAVWRFVMPGLVPGIHVLWLGSEVVDGRVKPAMTSF
jgi:hypothetical protein